MHTNLPAPARRMGSAFAGMSRIVAVAAFALALPQFSAGAQGTDSRWTPYLGCWAPIEAGVISITGAGSTDNLVCVVPSTSTSVDVTSIVRGRVVARTNVDASGARNVKNVDDCAGWESAKWSADGHRVMLRSEFRCANNTVRKESGVFSMTPEGQWLDVQGVDVVGTTNTRAVRFREIGVEPAALRSVASAAVGDSLRIAATGVSSFATQTLRAATAGMVTTDDVLDLSRNVDVQVAEAWLNETGQTFSLDARALVRLADAGLPPRMIDLLVALSYPKTFAVRPSTTSHTGGTPIGLTGTRIGSSVYGGYGSRSSFCDPFFGAYSSFGYLSSSMYGDCYGSRYSPYNQYGYGSRYGNGYYYGNQPIVIVNRSNIPVPENSNARAVNGRGYTRDRSADAGSSYGGSSMGSSSSRTSRSSGSSGSAGGSSGSSGSEGSSGSSGSSSGARTAKPKGGI